MALKIVRLAFQDIWQEFWTILIVHLLFLLGVILILPGPPAILALFFYGNRIAHDESANERDFLNAIRRYWKPAWRWGVLNLFMIGLLTGDYYLTARLANNTSIAAFIQGLYIVLLVAWLLLQLFALPFLFEQKEPLVLQALRNAAVFIGKNLIFVLTFALLLLLSLAAGMLVFMLTFVFGSVFLAFAGTRAVLEHLEARQAA